jgi:hypothetical protein
MLRSDRVGALRRSVAQRPLPALPGAGEAAEAEAFRVDGVFFDRDVKVVVHGDITSETVPRLETVLEGLLMLHPTAVVVEMDSSTSLEAEVRRWIEQREDDIVHFRAGVVADHPFRPLRPSDDTAGYSGSISVTR